MKKRNIFTLVLIAVLAFALGLGTMAYYKRTFTSSNNPVRFANFTVNTGGTLDESVEFDIPEPIAPGYINDAVHTFKIDKTGTEVPVEYDINVITNGEAFENGPLTLTLYNKVNGEWVAMEGLTALGFEPKADVEEFKLGLRWPHNDATDVDFEGKSGNIKIEVTATQVDEPEPATIVSLVNPDSITVEVGQVVNMPSVVVANMSDGTTKDVPVTWVPATIDTSTAGVKTAEGSVEGFDGKATFMVTVEEVPEPTLEMKFYAVGTNFRELRVCPMVENIKGADKFVLKYELPTFPNPTIEFTPMTKLDASKEDLPIIPFRAINGEVRIYDVNGILLHTFYNVKLFN